MEYDEYIDRVKRTSDNERDHLRRVGEETLDLVERTIVNLSTLKTITDAEKAVAKVLEGN